MDSQLRNLVARRAGDACEYCQVPAHFDRLPFQVDHVIAEKHGGVSEPENLAWSCFDCNIFKGPNIAGIDPESGQIVPLFHPRKEVWDQHFRRVEGAIHGHTAAARATIEVLRLNLSRRIAFRVELEAEGVLPAGG